MEQTIAFRNSIIDEEALNRDLTFSALHRPDREQARHP